MALRRDVAEWGRAGAVNVADGRSGSALGGVGGGGGFGGLGPAEVEEGRCGARGGGGVLVSGVSA